MKNASRKRIAVLLALCFALLIILPASGAASDSAAALANTVREK